MKKFTDLYEKTTSLLQRRKLARRMAKMAKSPIFQTRKRRALLRFRSPDRLRVVARKKVINMFRQKFFPSYDQMSIQQRVMVDQRLMTLYGPRIAKLSVRMYAKLKKLEVERVKQARASQRAQREDS